MWGILINSRSKYKDFTISHLLWDMRNKDSKEHKKPQNKKQDWLSAADWTTRKVWHSENANRSGKISHWKLGLFLEKQGLEAPQVNSACRRGHAAWLRSHLKATDPVRPVLTWFLSHWGRCRTALQTGTETSWRQDYSTKFTSTGDVIFLTQ